MKLYLLGRTVCLGIIFLLLFNGIAQASSHVKAQSGRALGDMLSPDGFLELPKGYSGQIDPSGYSIASGPGEQLRFELEQPNAGEVDQRWQGTGTVGNGCNGPIRASAVDQVGQKIYFGGEFRQCGNVAANFIAEYDLSTQSWSSLGLGADNGVSDVVHAIAIDGDQVYVGGRFEHAGRQRANFVARFDTLSKQWLSIGSGTTLGVDSTVYALAINADELFVGGGFFRAGGLESRKLARFNLITQSWSAVEGGIMGNFVFTLFVSGDQLYVGGDFLQVGSTEAKSIARLNLLTGSWSSLGAGSANGVIGTINSIAVVGDEVYVGGAFQFAGGNAANRIAYFNTSTQQWAAVISGGTNGVNGTISAMSAVGRALYVGGSFTLANGLSTSRVARFDTIARGWSDLSGGISVETGVSISTITAFGGSVYVGGNFPQAGDVPTNYVARFDTVKERWSDLGDGLLLGVNHSISAVTVAGDNIYVGGRFTMAGGTRANRVAYFNSVSRSWHALGNGIENGVDDYVYAIHVVGNDVYVGGYFSRAGGQTANRIARFNIASQTWSPLGNGLDSNAEDYVYGIASAGNSVYVLGNFYSVGGVPARSVARFDTTTESWYSLGNGTLSGELGGAIRVIAVSGSDVYVGGSFTAVDQLRARNLARFNAVSQSWSTVGVGPLNGVNNLVTALTLDGDNLYIGGYFTEAGGSSANQIVRFNTSSGNWSLLGRGPTNGVNGPIFNIAAANGKVFVSGPITRAGGMDAAKIACFTTETQQWSPLGSGIGKDFINDVVLLGSRHVVVGGAFGEAGASVTSNLAIYEVGAPTTLTVTSSSVNVALNQPVTLSANVSGAVGVPTGQVRLVADTDESCTFSAPAGSCELTFALPGTRSITAFYSGNGDYEANTSAAVSVIVVSSADYIFTVGFE